LFVLDAGGAVGGVALGGDALVPVVVGGGGVLDLDGFEPGVFARGLVEVSVDAEVARGRSDGLGRKDCAAYTGVVLSAHVSIKASALD